MVRVLFVSGLPDNNAATAVHSRSGLSLSVLGGSNVMQAIKRRPSSEVTVAGGLLLMGEGPEIPLESVRKSDVAFNEISDPDTHGIALSRAKKFFDGYATPVINKPEFIPRTARDYVSKSVNCDSILVPKTVKCQLTEPEQVSELAIENNLRYPLLVRLAGEHGGKTLVRLEEASDIKPLHALPLDGRDFYVTEFIDFKSPDGFYRKYRLAVVDGVAYPRHLIINDTWLIHAASRETMAKHPELANEEASWLASFDHSSRSNLQSAISALHRTTKLDYFGVDCNINEDNELILFEVNPNMNILINTRSDSDPTIPHMETILRAVERMIVSFAKGR